MRIGGYVARWGQIPPPAGPARRYFLEAEGFARLRLSSQLYSKAFQIISIELLGGRSLAEMPVGAYCDRLGGLLESRVRLARWRAASAELDRRHHQAIRLGRGSTFRKLLADAEAAARSSVQAAVDAYNYLEDDEAADFVHQQVHNIGEFASGYFGCKMLHEDGAYLDTCVVSLMHSRWGFSMGFTSTRGCSICDGDLEDCEHLLGHRYPVLVLKDEGGRCNVCDFDDCDHVVGNTQSVQPRAIHSNIDLHEVSMVARPRDPLLRPSSMEIGHVELTKVLGRRPVGEELECYRCLGPSEGFSSPWVSER